MKNVRYLLIVIALLLIGGQQKVDAQTPDGEYSCGVCTVLTIGGESGYAGCGGISGGSMCTVYDIDGSSLGMCDAIVDLGLCPPEN